MKTTKKSKSNVIFTVLLVFFSAVFLFSAYMVWKNVYEADKSAKAFDMVSELVTTQPEIQDEQKPSAPLTSAEKYADVFNKNNDFVGWIKIDGTRIDYPVVQTRIERDYYLRRGFDKKYSYYGVPYASEYSHIDVSSNTVIYGHNMDNGSMFSDLGKYTSKSFYESHKYITFDTMQDFGTYEIIAVFKTQVFSDSEFKYFRFTDGTQAEFDEFVSECKSLSLYDIETSACYGDKLLTLSTCEYSQNHGRIAVVAKKVSKNS